MKNFFSYLKKHNIIITIWIIALCSIVYFIRENVFFTTQLIAYINLAIIGVLIVVLFNAVRKHYVLWRYIICLLSVLFVFNRYYDEVVFFNTFHFKLIYFVFGVGLISAIAIFYPFIEKIISRLQFFLDEWGKEGEEKDSLYKKKHENRNTRNNKEDGFVNEEIDDSEEVQYENKGSGKKSSQGNYNAHSRIYVSIFLGQFLLLALMLFAVSSSKFSSVFEKMNSKNLPTAILSFLGVIILLVFATGFIISLLVKWYQIIHGILINEHKGEWYFIFACSLLLISQYIFKDQSLTLDDLVDLLLGGKLFTFPLILLIFIPIFLIFAENLISFTQENEKIKKALKECADTTVDIAINTIKSLLTFIQFVTSDYLTSIIEITDEEDLESSESEDEDLEDNEINE